MNGGLLLLKGLKLYPETPVFGGFFYCNFKNNFYNRFCGSEVNRGVYKHLANNIHCSGGVADISVFIRRIRLTAFVQFVAPPPCFFQGGFCFQLTKGAKKMITENMDLKEIRKALGLELFLRRQQKGMSLFHMAHHIKIDRRVLDRAETGRPVPLYTLMRIISHYGKKVRIELVE